MKKLYVLFLAISILAAISVLTAQSNAWLTNGLVAYYTFEEGEGDKTKDLSGFENHAAFAQIPDITNCWGAGKIGKGYVSNPVEGYIDAGMPPILAAITNEITVCAWLLLEGQPDQGGGPGIVCKWDVVIDRCSWFLGTEGGKFAAGISPTGARVDGIICNDENDPIFGEWVHLAMTFDGITLRMYTNGAFAASNQFSERKTIFFDDLTSVFIGRAHGRVVETVNRSITGTTAVQTTQTGPRGNTQTTTQNVLTTARERNNGWKGLEGTIDEVRIYSRVLKSREIRRIYDLTK